MSAQQHEVANVLTSAAAHRGRPPVSLKIQGYTYFALFINILMKTLSTDLSAAPCAVFPPR